ncbi:hypothetical protein BKA70DRAFT_1278897 [Coprinopsis sp. MPI-PUGE-AT-0042]|nr:hypothetical protein BKA70DRAFT_1278897 [Coprinopsis sp. MPI-PUGE-AT-0042]
MGLPTASGVAAVQRDDAQCMSAGMASLAILGLVEALTYCVRRDYRMPDCADITRMHGIDRRDTRVEITGHTGP